MRFVRLLLCMSLLSMVVVQDSFAQTPAAAQAPSTAMTDKARELYSEGVQLFRLKKWAQAEASFEAAWALAKHYSIAANLGETKLQLGKHRAAAELLAFALAHAPASEVAERKHGEALLATAKSKIGTLKIQVTPADATVTVGGRTVAGADLSAPVFVDPGQVEITAQKDRFDSLTKTVEVTAGASIPVELTLQPIPAPPPSSTATATPTSSAAPSSGPRTEIVVGGAALAGAAVVIGGVLVGLAEKTRGDLQADSPRNPDGSLACVGQTAPGTAVPICDELRAKARDGNALGQAGIGLLIGGGLIGLGTIGYAVFWPKPEKQSASSIVPVVGPRSAGLVWQGSF